MSVNGIDDLGYLPLTGNSATEKIMTGPIWFKSDIGGIYGTMGASDHYRIIGASTGEDRGYLELATSDNGNEPIYVRQYANSGTSFDSTKLKRTLTLLDGSGNTFLPGNLHVVNSLWLNESDSHITWNQGTTWQRVAITDASTNDENTFIFRKSNDSGSTWSDLATINGSGKITATENLKTNAGAIEFKDKVTQQYNSSEQCIEFIFN